MKRKLIILGGGVKGTATATIASLFDNFDVTLVEKDQIGSGATSTNHGRLHLGTAGYQNESSELIQRRCKASELVRQLPNGVVSKQNGLYCFEDKQDAQYFLEVAKENEIPHQILNNLSLSHHWIDAKDFSHIIQVPEHAFNPARLAGRFAQTCLDLGGRILTNTDVESIFRNPSNQKLRLNSNKSDELEADIIVNTLSRWTSTIDVPTEAPRPEIKWFRWSLLCLKSSVIEKKNKLNHVLMIVDRANKMPSAIPHANWMTLDFKATPVTEIYTPEKDDSEDWRLYNPATESDKVNLAAVREAFKPIQDLDDQTLNDNLYALAGIHGRRLNAPTGSRNHIETSDGFPDYFVSFGGQASTALLDAIDIVAELRRHYGIPEKSVEETMDRLKQVLSDKPIDDALPMRWEQEN